MFLREYFPPFKTKLANERFLDSKNVSSFKLLIFKLGIF